ncbi:MAG: HVO_2753 family zinc finger protein [Halobacteriales archaeon]
MSTTDGESGGRKRCISCGVNIVRAGFTDFDCPECGYHVHRCRKCRKQSNLYRCPDCGFTGP